MLVAITGNRMLCVGESNVRVSFFFFFFFFWRSRRFGAKMAPRFLREDGKLVKILSAVAALETNLKV